MTQGAISRQIQSLESIMGVTLFYRQARGLALTAEGDKFVPLAEDIIRRLQTSIREVADSANRIKLSAPSCITSWLLTRISHFQQQHSDINVELTSTTEHHMVPSFDRFDLIIRYGKPTRSKAYEQTLLFEEELAPMCSPELWHKIVGNQPSNSMSIEEALGKLTWLHANQEQSDWLMWLDTLDHSRMRGKGNQTFATLDQSVNAALHGFGIAIGDIMLSEHDLRAKRLIKPFEKSVKSGSGYYLLLPKNEQGTRTAQLVEWLVQSAH